MGREDAKEPKPLIAWEEASKKFGVLRPVNHYGYLRVIIAWERGRGVKQQQSMSYLQRRGEDITKKSSQKIFKGGEKTSQKNSKAGGRSHRKSFTGEGAGGELEIAKNNFKEREKTSQTNFKGGGKTLQQQKLQRRGEDITIYFQGWDKDPHKKRRFSRGNIATKATPFAVLLSHKKPPCRWCSTCLTPGCLWRGTGKDQESQKVGRWSCTQHYTVTTRMVLQYNGAAVWAILMVCWLLGETSQDHVCTPQPLKRKDSWGKLQLMYIRLQAWHVTTRPNWLMPAWWKATHLLSHYLFCNYSYLHIFLKLNLH